MLRTAETVGDHWSLYAFALFFLQIKSTSFRPNKCNSCFPRPQQFPRSYWRNRPIRARKTTRPHCTREYRTTENGGVRIAGSGTPQLSQGNSALSYAKDLNHQEALSLHGSTQLKR